MARFCYVLGQCSYSASITTHLATVTLNSDGDGMKEKRGEKSKKEEGEGWPASNSSKKVILLDFLYKLFGQGGERKKGKDGPCAVPDRRHPIFSIDTDLMCSRVCAVPTK